MLGDPMLLSAKTALGADELSKKNLRLDGKNKMKSQRILILALFVFSKRPLIYKGDLSMDFKERVFISWENAF